MVDGGARCGPNFGYCTGTPSNAIYCNEDNGWCGDLDEHKNAQLSTTYDLSAYTTCLEQQPSKFTEFFSLKEMKKNEVKRGTLFYCISTSFDSKSEAIS